MADADEVVETESHHAHGLGYLQQTARDRRNVIEELIEAVRPHSAGRDFA
jgi:isobutyryl-CoA mutase